MPRSAPPSRLRLHVHDFVHRLSPHFLRRQPAAQRPVERCPGRAPRSGRRTFPLSSGARRTHDGPGGGLSRDRLRHHGPGRRTTRPGTRGDLRLQRVQRGLPARLQRARGGARRHGPGQLAAQRRHGARGDPGGGRRGGGTARPARKRPGPRSTAAALCGGLVAAPPRP